MDARAVALDRFHPALSAWFERRFPGGPTKAQAEGWASIAQGRDTLICAPTGSGKTLAGFLVAIDRCLRSPRTGPKQTAVVYVSPLRALTVDVAENLERPLAEIAAIGAQLGTPLSRVTVAVRNGDTPQRARAAMLRDPPDLLVTTPESLYLLLTARRGRELLARVDTVIVDEIHALARDKRGAHLALSLERLDACVQAAGGPRPIRIGLSATQRPLSKVARLLVGAGTGRSLPDGTPRCALVDVGHDRALDLAVELPRDELGAICSNEQLASVVASLAEKVRSHATTLVFVNTRRMAERLAHLLAGELGEDVVAAHHASLSTERRLFVEARLRSGELRAVVATASLELGIDVGPVELVCQLGSPRSIATFLQRVGRAQHHLGGVAKGVLYPLTRDELVECLGLLKAVREGRLDRIEPADAPLDVLAQHVVAECAARGEEGVSEAELRFLVEKAAPYAGLADNDWEAVLELVSEGVTTGRGRRGAYVHRDRIGGRLRARRGARLVASTSGGAIPELADYRVVAEPDEALVGTVHEDFAVESMVGDVFLLGSTSWRVRRVEAGTVRVVDAEGAPPTVPFWLGEAPSRTDELAEAVSEVRSLVETALEGGGVLDATRALALAVGVEATVAREAVAYLAAGREQLGALPTRSRLVLERFFDETGGMQLVIHTPYGARVNRGLGLALRKRFCRSFDFELQAAASDDAVVLSLGPQHSFPLEDVVAYLSPGTVEDVLVQAVLATPIFTARWRWNLTRALVVPRFRGSRKLPPAIQRMEADDVMAAVFPMLAACQENVSGPIDVPDHLLVRQTLKDCCSEAIDLVGLVGLVEALRAGTVEVRCVDTTEPSVLAHEILSSRPYTFLDDAPLEERRSRAVRLRRGLPVEAHDLSVLAPEVLAEVTEELRAAPRDPEELHELLVTGVLIEPDARFEADLDVLVRARRAARVRAGNLERWCATERRRYVEALWPTAAFEPDVTLPAALGASPAPSEEDALDLALSGLLERRGPSSPGELARSLGLDEGRVVAGLARLERSGFVLAVEGGRVCARRVAARLAERARSRGRRMAPAVSAQGFMRFLLEWQHVAPSARVHGREGLVEVVGQLQGVELAVGAWEASVLPARVSGYTSQLLDALCSEGLLTWGRISLRPVDLEVPVRRSGASPSRATPVTIALREDLASLLAVVRGSQKPGPPGPGVLGEIVETLEAKGALFLADLCEATGRLPLEVAEGLWDGVARGLLTADGFGAIRSLLAGRYRAPRLPERGSATALGRQARLRTSWRRPRPAVAPALAGGRWSLLDKADPAAFEPDALAEAVAAQLLMRWGVVFYELAVRETFSLAWREVLWALRRLEARGLVRGGRFVAGFSGEQYALPEAAEQLRAVAGRSLDGAAVRLSAADPLNLTGIVLPGPRIPALAGRELVLVDGMVADDEHAQAHAGKRARHHPYGARLAR
jgi:ATP-dependent Lhr-like helicase